MGASGVILQSQVFQLVPRQPLTQVVRLLFTVQLPIIQPLFSLPLFHSPSLSCSSRIFRSSFSSFSIRLRSCRASLLLFFLSSYLLLFSLFYIHSNTVQFRLQAYVLSSPKIFYFFSKKNYL